MKVCIIGNSHTAALKTAWTALEEWHELLELVFFAAPGTKLRAITTNNSCLYTEEQALKSAFAYTSGGLEEIIPNDYDAVLVYGAQCRPYFKPSSFYSSAVLQQAQDDLVTNSLSFAIVKMVSGLTDNQIFVGSDPLPASGQDGNEQS